MKERYTKTAPAIDQLHCQKVDETKWRRKETKKRGRETEEEGKREAKAANDASRETRPVCKTEITAVALDEWKHFFKKKVIKCVLFASSQE